MSFADPQSVTISGVTTSLPRVSSPENTGRFRSADGSIVQAVSTAYGRRTRHTIRLDTTKVAADVFLPSTNVSHSMSVYLVVDRPTVGFTNAEAKAVADGLVTVLTASSGAKLLQLLGGEN